MAHEALSAFLFELGCTGITFGDGPEDRLVAYFPWAVPPEELESKILSFTLGLTDIFPGLPRPQVSIGKLEHQDWGMAWRRFFHRAQVTPRLLVVPAWEEIPARIDGPVIRMDPGPAFGTGLHPTTQMCLEAMETTPVSAPWSFLDVGTGSGILSMYASLLGASRILAVDIDEEALRWAEHNLALNGLSGSIRLEARPVARIRERFFVVAANLIFQEIVALLEDLKRITEPNGWLVLSGILKEQEARLARRLDEAGLGLWRTLAREEWRCMIARNLPDEK